MSKKREAAAGFDEDESEPETLAELEDAILRMKNTSELMVDLAYGALLYSNREIAEEVEELETLVDRLMERVVRGLLVVHAAGGLGTDTAVGLHRLALAAEAIADSAQGIADVVLRDVELHPIVSQSIRESDVILTRLPVNRGATLDAATLGSAHLMTETGMRVVAIRRGRRYIYGPTKDTEVFAGDVLLARGPAAGESDLRRLCGVEDHAAEG